MYMFLCYVAQLMCFQLVIFSTKRKTPVCGFAPAERGTESVRFGVPVAPLSVAAVNYTPSHVSNKLRGLVSKGAGFIAPLSTENKHDGIPQCDDITETHFLHNDPRGISSEFGHLLRVSKLCVF